jgi:hypothetical protein
MVFRQSTTIVVSHADLELCVRIAVGFGMGAGAWGKRSSVAFGDRLFRMSCWA